MPAFYFNDRPRALAPALLASLSFPLNGFRISCCMWLVQGAVRGCVAQACGGGAQPRVQAPLGRCAFAGDREPHADADATMLSDRAPKTIGYRLMDAPTTPRQPPRPSLTTYIRRLTCSHLCGGRCATPCVFPTHPASMGAPRRQVVPSTAE